MPKEKPIEIFMPPNMLKAKVGGSFGGIDASMLRRAETAMEEMKTEFTNWLGADVDKLVEARDGFAALCDKPTQDALLRASHDLKGGAQTYDYPLIGRIAGSLCRLMEGAANPQAIPLVLVDAHVNAIKIVHRQDIRDATNRMAVTLSEELENRVTEMLEKAR
ncbi:MAG TPA: hypothetical protein VGG10_08095 [Rhizomicrobium sp.]